MSIEGAHGKEDIDRASMEEIPKLYDPYISSISTNAHKIAQAFEEGRDSVV